jgi:hypothetical protein
MGYGFKATRLVVETLAQYQHEPGLTRIVHAEDIFAPSTLSGHGREFVHRITVKWRIHAA